MDAPEVSRQAAKPPSTVAESAPFSPSAPLRLCENPLLAAACAAGELTTPAAREICRLALDVCELELENAALRGQLDGLKAAPHAGVFAVLVADELAAARRLYGRITTAHEAASVIREEFEEFWEHVRRRQHERSPAILLKELIQVAAMCQRSAEDLKFIERASAELRARAADRAAGAVEPTG